jgi:hypothetical protein
MPRTSQGRPATAPQLPGSPLSRGAAGDGRGGGGGGVAGGGGPPRAASRGDGTASGRARDPRPIGEAQLSPDEGDEGGGGGMGREGLPQPSPAVVAAIAAAVAARGAGGMPWADPHPGAREAQQLELLQVLRDRVRSHMGAGPSGAAAAAAGRGLACTGLPRGAGGAAGPAAGAGRHPGMSQELLGERPLRLLATRQPAAAAAAQRAQPVAEFGEAARGEGGGAADPAAALPAAHGAQAPGPRAPAMMDAPAAGARAGPGSAPAAPRQPQQQEGQGGRGAPGVRRLSLPPHGTGAGEQQAVATPPSSWSPPATTARGVQWHPPPHPHPHSAGSEGAARAAAMGAPRPAHPLGPAGAAAEATEEGGDNGAAPAGAGTGGGIGVHFLTHGGPHAPTPEGTQQLWPSPGRSRTHSRSSVAPYTTPHSGASGVSNGTAPGAHGLGAGPYATGGCATGGTGAWAGAPGPGGQGGKSFTFGKRSSSTMVLHAPHSAHAERMTMSMILHGRSLGCLANTNRLRIACSHVSARPGHGVDLGAGGWA